MIVRLIKSGKPDGLCHQISQKYQNRLKSWVRLEVMEFKNDVQVIKFLQDYSGKPDALVVSLDERGKMWSSPQLARFMDQNLKDPAIKSVNFVVGSPYGLSEDLKKKCGLSWSLSPAVFPADLAWILLNEQVYRAFSILKGSPYHHE